MFVTAFEVLSQYWSHHGGIILKSLLEIIFLSWILLFFILISRLVSFGSFSMFNVQIPSSNSVFKQYWDNIGSILAELLSKIDYFTQLNVTFLSSRLANFGLFRLNLQF